MAIDAINASQGLNSANNTTDNVSAASSTDASQFANSLGAAANQSVGGAGTDTAQLQQLIVLITQLLQQLQGNDGADGSGDGTGKNAVEQGKSCGGGQGGGAPNSNASDCGK